MRAKINVVDGSKIRILAFENDLLGKISQKTIDLTPYAGQRTRVWLEKDGTYSLNPNKDHYWQVAEIDVPDIIYQDIEVEDPENKMMTTQSEALPLDLSGVNIMLFDLPGISNIGQPIMESMNG